MISLVVPTVVLIVFGEDCYSHWLLTWEPCLSKDSFVFQARVHRTMIGNSGGDWVDGFWLPITQHADICLPKYTEGKCSRFVVERLSELFEAKLMFGAFLSPGIALLLGSSCLREVQASVLRRLGKEPGEAKPEYLELDAEVTTVMLTMFHAMTMGVITPILIPLSALEAAGHLAVLHLNRARHGLLTRNETLPEFDWLYIAVVLNIMLIVWFYTDNSRTNKVHGNFLVYIAVFLMIPVGATQFFVCERYGILDWIERVIRVTHDADATTTAEGTQVELQANLAAKCSPDSTEMSDAEAGDTESGKKNGPVILVLKI